MSESLLEIITWKDSTVIDSHLCRICFSLSELLIPIFEGEGIEQRLCEKVEKYLPVKILPSDHLPQKICYPCASTLIAWDSLYIVCVKTNEILDSRLKENKQGKLKKEEINLDDSIMPPKKRKLTNLKEKTKNVSESPLKFKKVKSAFGAKKIKLVDKCIEKDEMNEKGKDKVISQNEAVKSGSREEDSLITVIKTEHDLEDVETHYNKLGNKNEREDASPIQCKLCGKSYKSKKCLSRHLKKFHEQVKVLKVQKCSICPNIYKTKANLERHYLKEHLTDQVQCPVCHGSFNSKKLDFHLKSIHGVKLKSEEEEKFKCKICDKWFKNKYVRNSHMKDTHLSEPMKCKLCDFEGVRTVLRRHKRDVHAEKKFVCSLCPGAFKTLHTLKMHMTSHSDIRCYTCDICGMGFKRLNNVRDHMKCHEEKSNQCQICGNFFARKRYLAIHEKTIHNFYADGIVPEEKGFECGICGAKLKWKKNLLAHMRIHTGEKPYICKICNKDFICHGSLRTHMAKHSVCTASEGDSKSGVH